MLKIKKHKQQLIMENIILYKELENNNNKNINNMRINENTKLAKKDKI